MKKILTIILLAIVSLTGSAQDSRFRTFVDVHAGTSISEGFDLVDPYSTDSDIKPILEFGLNFTGGYQITPYLFAGVGFGGYAVMMGYEYNWFYEDSYSQDGYSWHEDDFYSLYFPFYVDVRWDLNVNYKVTPFVDIRIGYQFGVPVSEGALPSYNPYSSLGNYSRYFSHRNGVYFVPTVGVRFGKKTAFNLGLSYNPTIGWRIYENSIDNNGLSKQLLHEATSGALQLSFGIDF